MPPMDGVELTRSSSNQISSVNKEECIFCQTQTGIKLTTTPNGRKRVRDVAEAKQDIITKRLKLLGSESIFYYHVTNTTDCYKAYTKNCIFSFSCFLCT